MFYLRHFHLRGLLVIQQTTICSRLVKNWCLSWMVFDSRADGPPWKYGTTFLQSTTLREKSPSGLWRKSFRLLSVSEDSEPNLSLSFDKGCNLNENFPINLLASGLIFPSTTPRSFVEGRRRICSITPFQPSRLLLFPCPKPFFCWSWRHQKLLTAADEAVAARVFPEALCAFARVSNCLVR